MLLKMDGKEDDVELASKILAAAFRQSVERGDDEGTQLAHVELCKLLTIDDKVQNDHNAAPVLNSADSSVPSVYAWLDLGEDPPAPVFTCTALAERPLPDPEGATYYEQIAAEQNDTFYLVQLCYMRAVRQLLRRNYAGNKLQAANIHDFRRQLRNMGIAYHVLNDPLSRTDYDLRLAGIRTPLSGLGLYVPEEARAPASGGRVRLSFEELLALSGLSSGPELPVERPSEEDFFAGLAFLLTSVQLESLRIGYELVGKGLISILQFQKAFLAVKNSEQKLVDILVASGWLDEHILNQLREAASELEFAAPKIVEVAVNTQSAPVPLPQLNVSSAVPSWASNMDWEDDSASSESAEAPVATATVESVESVATVVDEVVAPPINELPELPVEEAASPENAEDKKGAKNARRPSKRRKKSK